MMRDVQLIIIGAVIGSFVARLAGVYAPFLASMTALVLIGLVLYGWYKRRKASA